MTRTVRTLALSALLAAPFAAFAQTTDQPLTPQTFINVSRKVLPSVVSISLEVKPDPKLTSGRSAKNLQDLMRQMLEDPDSFREQFGERMYGFSTAGSGVIIRADKGKAYVLTNNHVLQEDDDADITIALDSSYCGEDDETVTVEKENIRVVGRDKMTDLAVLEFDIPPSVKNIATAEFADSDKLEVGEWVVALGNPLHYSNSISEGIIAAKHRQINKSDIEDLVQTTAVINPGNSGGPLVNLDGRIVGINNAIASDNGRWQGIGFAIPSTQASRISKMLIEDGRVGRGYLGIGMQTLDSALSATLDLEHPRGVLVNQVVAGGPADIAGVEVGDVITKVDGRKIAGPPDILRLIGSRTAKEEVTLSLLRLEGSKTTTHDVKASLVERPSEEELLSLDNKSSRRRDAQADRGPKPSDVLDAVGLRLGSPADGGGLEVRGLRADSPAESAGIREGDRILAINGIKCRNHSMAVEGLENVRPGKQHMILFERDGENQFVTVEQAK